MDCAKCPEENTVYLYVHSEDPVMVMGYCRVGDTVLQGYLLVNPAWSSAKDIARAIKTQTRSGQLSLNKLNGFDFASDYEFCDLKLDYPVVVIEVAE